MTTDLTPRSLSPVYTPTEIITVQDRAVVCDGGDGPLGHPRIWQRIIDRQLLCPYCSRLFVLAEGAGHDTGH